MSKWSKCKEHKTIASFNFVGLPPKFCKICKSPEMISIKNLNRKKCLKCTKQPSYNFKDLKPLYCITHIEKGMEYVSKKSCKKCNKRPIFNFDGLSTPILCADHREVGMINKNSTKCKTCKLFIVRNKNDNCFTCRRGLKTIRHETIIKEQLELSILKNYSSYDISHPCSNEMGIRKIRPDFTWETEKNIMILEVDENAHRLYNVECEQGRIHELHELFQKPLILVRYNPDAKMSILNQTTKKEHSYLITTLENILQDKFDGLVIRGNEEIKVIYIGYKEERINELWNYIETIY